MTIAQTLREAALDGHFARIGYVEWSVVMEYETEPYTYGIDFHSLQYRTFLLFVAEALEGVDSR